MTNDEIKNANRKALPTFLLVFAICAIIGGIAGYCSARYGLDGITGTLKAAGAFFGNRIAPWLMLAAAVVLPMVCVPLYHRAAEQLRSWDGEDEDTSGAIERKLSAVIWISSAALVLSYFLIAASYSGGFSTFDSKEQTIVFFIGIAGFFGILVEAVILQQKCVDTVKRINPEKKVSAYDMKFQKKWMDECDEAEKLLVGKCAYKAYAATNVVCTALGIVLAICALLFDIGFLPSLVVCLVWMVNLSAYCKEAMRYSKAGNKIS